MSEDPAHGATTIRPSKGSAPVGDKGGGGGGKLLIGAIAAVVLVGGGYFVWKTYGATENGAQNAYNDSYNSGSYADDPLRAGPNESNDSTIAEGASSEAAPPASSSRSTSTPARRQTADANAVPEETIGIMPIDVASTASATEGDDIVVTASRRPIWVRTPSARRLSALYPERALERGREGEARLSCTVQGDGALDCARVEETPGGFGPAAIRVARTLRHAPRLADGSDAAGSPVNLRVVFRMDDDQRRG